MLVHAHLVLVRRRSCPINHVRLNMCIDMFIDMHLEMCIDL